MNKAEKETLLRRTAPSRQKQDFIDLSRRIAGVIFEQMLQYQAIPAGDLAVVDFTADGVPFYGVLKLNYRRGHAHVQPADEDQIEHDVDERGSN